MLTLKRMTDNTAENRAEQLMDNFMLTLRHMNLPNLLIAQLNRECDLVFGFETVPESLEQMRRLVENMTNWHPKGIIKPYWIDEVQGLREYVASGFIMLRLLSSLYFFARSNRTVIRCIPDPIDETFALSGINSSLGGLTLRCWYGVHPEAYMHANARTGVVDVDYSALRDIIDQQGPQIESARMLIGYTRVLRLPGELDVRGDLIFDRAYVFSSMVNDVYTVRVINLVMHYIRRRMRVWIKRVRERLEVRRAYRMMHTKYAGMFPCIHAFKRERDF